MRRVLKEKPRVSATRVSTVAGLAIIYALTACGQGAHPTPSEMSGASMPGSTCAASALLPDGNPSVPYHATLTCSGGTPPYTWSLLSGTLPSGLTLNRSAGLISGTPSQATEASFTVQVTDSSSPVPQTAQIHATLNIVNPGPYDPELPQVFMDTTFPDTTGYLSKTVCASGCNYTGLQAPLNNIHTDGGDTNGEIILLASGTTFTANYTLPAYTMASGKWIIVTTNTASSNLPAQGVRIAPTYSPTLARIFSGNSGAVFQTANNANHYWFLGVEIGVASGVATNYGTFIVGNGDTSTSTLPSYIVLDRCYLHGNATGNVSRGLAANGSYLAVINSYFENFHINGGDAQAIAAWNGPGPFEIDNNFLEGAAENVIFGGADPTIPNLVNSDIEIRQNHFFRPLSWKSDDPSYAGILWSVKNLLEFKNAQRVLVEGNVLENNWLQAQNGFGVLFTPRNQNGGCPWCTVSNITFRYNILQHSGSGFNISGEDSDHPSLPATNIDIHDNLMLDINGTAWGGADGRLYQILNGEATPVLASPANITINHNTGISTGSSWFTTGDSTVNAITGLVLENNIQAENVYGFFGGGVGTGNAALRAYYRSPVFTNNVDVSGSARDYPSGNFFPTSWATVDLVDNTNCQGGTFSVSACALKSGSPYHNAGSDGKDIGANIGAVNAATAGVSP